MQKLKIYTYIMQYSILIIRIFYFYVYNLYKDFMCIVKKIKTCISIYVYEKKQNCLNF